MIIFFLQDFPASVLKGVGLVDNLASAKIVTTNGFKLLNKVVAEGFDASLITIPQSEFLCFFYFYFVSMSIFIFTF